MIRTKDIQARAMSSGNRMKTIPEFKIFLPKYTRHITSGSACPIKDQFCQQPLQSRNPILTLSTEQ
jgi:hypothetical protein